jgi:peptide-methionine (S)-S-oxide reductase
MNAEYDLATFGGGCFWCTEAVFQRIEGVKQVVSGYCGGKIDHPTYREICTGTTGHAEVIQMHFDAKLVSYAELLDVFFAVHDPTTLNRQGNDRGTQYRSVIFYHSVQQASLAAQAIEKHQSEWTDPIITEIAPIKVFYPAEESHQNYFNEHGEQPYCAFVIAPKVEKFDQKFGGLKAK